MNSLRMMLVLLVCSVVVGTAQGVDSGSITGVMLNRVGNDFQLAWTTQGDVEQVRIYAGTDPDNLDDLTSVVGADQVTITGLAPQLRHYFRVRGGNGRGTAIAERGLPQANVVNLRDIGGYTAPNDDNDGERYIGWGRFFRTGFVQPSANQAFLASLGIRTVVDARGPMELASQGPQNVPAQVVIPAPIYDVNGAVFDPLTPFLCFPGNQTPACYAAQEAHFGPHGEFLYDLKQQVFRGLVTGNGPPGLNLGQTIRDAIRTLLVTLADENNLPLVWADTGGEGRVGWGSAVVELLLGVPEDQVVLDYTLTTQFRQAATQAQINALVGSGLLKKAEYVLPQFLALPVYMEVAIEEMHTLYGSAEDYARALGVTDAQIRQIRKNLLRNN